MAATLLALTPDGDPAARAAAATGSAAQPVSATTVTTAAARGDDRPNIVLIMTDDQNVSDLQYMPRTRRLLADAGVEATGFISPHPLCCPSRAEILSGEYAQNNGVRHNKGRFGGYQAFTAKRRNVTDNLGAWLHRAGYRTALVGKLLNGYERHRVRLKGWDHWNPLQRGVYRYYGSRFTNDGHPRTYRKQYVADVITDYANRYIREFTRGRDDRPFFLWASHVGPHNSLPSVPGALGPIPPKRYAGTLAGLTNPSRSKPSYNEADVSDKAAPVAAREEVDGAVVDQLAQLRAETVLSLDDSVASILATLREVGELRNTIVVYTSDNGYFLGEHRLLAKNDPYEENLRVPFLIRGPGLPAGTTTDEPISMVDLASTFLARAGALKRVRGAGRTDGIDAYPVLQGAQSANATQLIQAGDDTKEVVDGYGWRFRGVRTSRYSYAHWYTGDEELFDNRLDPYQLQNVSADPRYADVLTELRRRTAALVDCRGVRQCRQQSFGEEPQPLLLRAGVSDAERAPDAAAAR